MNIQIILTSYLLQFMFGENPFQDPLLLSREVIKKAYNEGLYFISNERSVDAFLTSKKHEGTFFVFAGIPSFDDICLNLSALSTIYAVKINLPYEELAQFELKIDAGDMILYKNNVLCQKENFQKELLHLVWQDHTLQYASVQNDDIPLKETFQDLIQKLNAYSFAISSNVQFLEKEMDAFLSSKDGEKWLENEENLDKTKKVFEMLT